MREKENVIASGHYLIQSQFDNQYKMNQGWDVAIVIYLSNNGDVLVVDS